MSLLNFDSSSPKRSGEKKTLSVILGIGALVGVIALGSTLAASINLNSGDPVEFGQGVAQTTACDDEITLTPISTFVNEEGEGSHKFSSLKVSGIDSNPGKCAGKTFVIKAYGDSGQLDLFKLETRSTNEVTDTVEWQEVDRYNSIEIRKDADEFTWISEGTDNDDVISETSNLTQTSFTLLFTSVAPEIRRTPLASAEDVKRITIESKDSVDATPVGYSVGEIGPGGGIVFYVSTDFFTSSGSTCDTACKYLEVAPATWQSAGGAIVENDSYFQWLDDYIYGATGQDKITASTEGYSVDEKANWKIGQGLYNTSVMKVPGSISSTSQAAVLAYAGGSAAGQWFIPSMNELNELCKYARGQTTGNPKVACDGNGTLKTGTANEFGGFVENDYYWTSTEDNGSYARVQSFGDGFLNLWPKHFDSYVRPIRAF